MFIEFKKEIDRLDKILVKQIEKERDYFSVSEKESVHGDITSYFEDDFYDWNDLEFIDYIDYLKKLVGEKNNMEKLNVKDMLREIENIIDCKDEMIKQQRELIISLQDEIEKNKYGFYEDSQGNTLYKGKLGDYSFLKGISEKGYSSDIVFIYKEPNIENDEPGEVIDFYYGGFSENKLNEKIIKEYEEKKMNGDK